MPACHSHLVRLVDLHHPRTFDHRRSIIIATSSPRVSPHFFISLLRHFLAFSPLRRTASSLCARSRPWSTQPPYPTRSPLREYRWISYASGLLVPLLSSTFGITSLLLLVSTPPHFSDFGTLDSSYAPSRLCIPFHLLHFTCLLFHVSVLPVPRLARLLTRTFDDFGWPLVDYC